MFQINAVVTITTDGGTISRQIPTFFLDRNVQGINTHAHARRIATQVITASFINLDNVELHIDVASL